MRTQEGKESVDPIERVALPYIYYHVCKIASCCLAQGTQPGAFWDDLEGWNSG